MRAVVVGAGISGLAAAYYLTKAGIETILVEKDRLGGVIRTDHEHGCVLEEGPDSFLASKPWALELIRELDLEDQVIGSNDSRRVIYLVKNSQLEPLPAGLMMMAPTRILPMARTRLLSWPTKIQMALEWFRARPKQMLDRSVAEFVTDHYGREALDYLAEPLLAGVYGGDVHELSARSVLPRFAEAEAQVGSLTRWAVRQRGSSGSLFKTLKSGLQTLVDRLAPRAGRIFQGCVEAVEPGWRVRIDGAWVEADAVVLACRAFQSARLVRPLEPRLSGLLDAIPYNPAMTVTLGYAKRDLQHPLNGFGFLVPQRERRALLACTWVNNKFDFRAPEDIAVLRGFCAPQTMDLDDESAVAAVRADLLRLMRVTGEPSFRKIARWPQSMPQYTVGHRERVSGIEELRRGLPGLYLAGNGYDGLGIPDCIRSGREAAKQISAAAAGPAAV